MLFAMLLGMPAGVIAAVKRGSVYDQTLMGVALTGYSMPIFWWGLLLILLVSGYWGLTPVSGRIDPIKYYFEPITGFMLIDTLLIGQAGAFKDAVRHLILPTIVLGTIPLAVIARMTRSSMLEVLDEDYVRTARAKGLSPVRVIGLHALRNALIPVVTMIGLQVGTLLAGAVLTETIFSWPGVGKWLIESIGRRDYPALQGGIMLISEHRDRRQPLVDLALRPHQPEDPPCPLTSPCRRCRAPAAARSASPNSGAPSARTAAPSSASSSSSLIILIAHLRAVRRAAFAHRAVPRHRAHAAGLARRRRLELPARHRRRRPRHPLAPHLRRPHLAVHRPVGDGRLRSSSASRSASLAAFFGGARRHRSSCASWTSSSPMPSLVLAILIVAIIGPSLANTIVAVTIVYLPHYVRLVRASALTELVEGLRHRGRASPASARCA